ncbi:TIGR00296 family protein [Candidatus Woesearchaeota archaeon]|nr:TIGR00296 family protein [Candidatus Woesearchaeota archaeon]
MLTLGQGKRLINLAREAISSHFDKKKLNVDRAIKEGFSSNMGAFVTLNKGKELRGCIGFPEPIYPLYDAVIKAATGAAFSDPRFMQLEKEELDKITVEVSVLTPPAIIEVRNPEDIIKKIKVGRDGLLVRGIFNSGLLLPQVAVEYKWNAITFLQQTCVKAGLEPNIWRDFDKCRVYKFEGQVFSEQSPNGEVKQIM